MRKLLILLLLPFLMGAAPTRPNSFTSGTTIRSSEVNVDFNTLYNYLTAGVDTYVDGSIINADVSVSAAIANSKLNLASVSQDVVISGAVTISGGTILSSVSSLIATAALDIGSFGFRSSTLTADALTSGRVVFASTDGLLTDDADFSFATDTLTATKIIASTDITLTNTVTKFSTDGTFAGNSDSFLPTEKAAKTYADTKLKEFGTWSASSTLTGTPATDVFLLIEADIGSGAETTTVSTPNGTQRAQCVVAPTTPCSLTVPVKSGNTFTVTSPGALNVIVNILPLQP